MVMLPYICFRALVLGVYGVHSNIIWPFDVTPDGPRRPMMVVIVMVVVVVVAAVVDGIMRLTTNSNTCSSTYQQY